MNAAIIHRLERLDRHQTALLTRARTLSPEALTARPAPHQWSVAELLTHLLTSEALSVRYMKKKALGLATLEKTGISHDLKMILLRWSQRLPFRYRAPRVVVDHTPTLSTLEAVETAWQQVRAELHDLLEGLGEGDLKRALYKHPAAGRLNVLHALDFFYEHLHHHQPQFEKLMAWHHRQAASPVKK